MPLTWEKVAETACRWATRPDATSRCVGIAGTMRHMADRLANSPGPNLAGEKSLKVLGCYLCRQIGEAVCTSAQPATAPCPLGFAPYREESR